MRRWLMVGALCALASFSAHAEEDEVRKDLFAVITLQGQPCGAVESYERRGENDYLVRCRTGDRYRVYVRDGRAVVERQ